MQDLLIVCAGPAGAIAGLVAARAGARVRILDRSAFPRHKPCGDSLNPGALAILRRLGVSDSIEARGLPVAGMVVTGEGGVVIEGWYPGGLLGRSIIRRDLDAILLDAAVGAGCALETGVLVRRAIVADERGAPSVSGVVVASRGRERSLPAPVVIAADGRRSRLTFSLGLAQHPARPRRWAIGAYFAGVGPVSDQGRTPVRPQNGRSGGVGEMHVRRNCYIGVAPVPGGLTNVCLVIPAIPGSAALRDPAAVLTHALAADQLLRDRFADAVLATPP